MWPFHLNRSTWWFWAKAHKAVLLATSRCNMTVFLDYTHVDEDGIRALEMTTDENDIKRFEIHCECAKANNLIHKKLVVNSLKNTGFYTKYSTYQVKKNQSRESSLTIISITTRKAHMDFRFLRMRFSYCSYFLIRFCKKSAFDSRQTSTLLSIMSDLLIYDMGASTLTHNMHQSFQRFQDLLMRHSVERPPKRYF